MKENELVSIIIPFYNGEKYARECLDSVLNQDYDNYEVIAIDDGSTDQTSNILLDYSKKNTVVRFFKEKNQGVSAARNNALSKVCGKYICFIDQDDTIDSNYISYFYNLIKKHNADIATSYQPFKFNSKTTKKDDYGHDDIELIDGNSAALSMLYYKFVIAPWNKMISFKLIKENNICFNEKLFGGEGFKFSIDCFKAANKVAVSNKKIYNYRCDNATSGMTSFKMRVVDSSIYAQELILEEMDKNNEKLIDACRYARWHTYTDMYNYFIGCGVVNKYKEKYKLIKKVVRNNALVAITAPINKKEKIKGLLYFINPYITAKIINKLRIRKFTLEEKE